MTIFVGDEPSKLNTDPEVAFVGSKSMPNLQKWIDFLDPEDPRITNSHTDALVEAVALAYFRGATVVALGNKASERLKKRNIEHFRLPHPSPKNRVLNDKNFIDSELEKCKNYLKVSRR